MATNETSESAPNEETGLQKVDTLVEKSGTSPSKTILLFLIFGALITLLIWSLVDAITPNASTLQSLLLLAGAAIIIFGGWGYLGYVNLPVGWTGVLLFFGERLARHSTKETDTRSIEEVGLFTQTGITLLKGIAWFAYGHLLKEGKSIILPYPIMEIEAVNIQKRSMTVKQEGNDEVGILVGKDDAKVPMAGKVTLNWQVIDPSLSLSIDEAVIEKTLNDLVITIFRDKTKTMEPREVIEQTTELGKLIGLEVDEIANDWGIDVTNIFISSFKITDKKMAEAYQNLEKERLEQQSETTQSKHITNMIKETSDGLEIGIEEAARIVLSSIGKIPSQDFHFSGNAISNLEGAAALLRTPNQ